MIADISKGVDRIFEIEREIRIAEIKGDKGRVEERLIEGLAVSCQLLRDIQQDTALFAPGPPEPVWALFRGLKAEKRLHEFFNIEREMLRRANVRPGTADDLVYATEQVVDFLVENRPDREPHWRIRLSDLEGEVCPAAHDVSSSRRRRPLLRKAALAAGGGLIAVSAPISVPATVAIAGIPVARALAELGKWLMELGGEGVLKERDA